MLALYIAAPRSIINAWLLSKIRGASPVFAGNMNSFFFSENAGNDHNTLNASSFSLHLLYKEYRETRGEISFIEDMNHLRHLEHRIFHALRSGTKSVGSGSNFSMVLKVLDQALDKGPEYVTAKISKEARELYSRSSKVRTEIRRARDLVRLEPKDDMLVGRGRFEHAVEDLVVLYFSERYPENKLVLVSKGRAFVCSEGELWIESADKYGTPYGKKKGKRDGDFDRYWEAYYDSQYITGRRNRKLALRGLPKKYWDWVEEGWKIDHGIPGVKLEDFN